MSEEYQIERVDLGPVSAWAVAKANGFEGTEAEWEAYIAGASTAAAAAAASAEEAASSAASVSYPVSYHAQTLTGKQQGQARANIEAARKTAVDELWKETGAFIDGAELALADGWEQNALRDDGTTTGSSYSIVTGFLPAIAGAALSFTGVTELNDTLCLAYVCQYSSNAASSVIGEKEKLYGSDGAHTVTLADSCAYIKLQYAHLSSSGVNMSLAQGAYFSAKMVKAPEAPVYQPLPLGLHTMPESAGQLNVVKRCRQMTEIKWTPAVDLPRLDHVTKTPPNTESTEYYEAVFKAGVEYTGIPYGRCQSYKGPRYGKETTFVGVEIGFDTFVTAVSNANSMVCQESVFNMSDHRSIPYALVCSAFVCYALNVPWVATAYIHSITGMTKVCKVIDDGVRMDLSLLKLGDLLIDPDVHIAMVTDIVTENGEVAYVEISEATNYGDGNPADWDKGGPLGGLCRRIGWTAEDFFWRHGAGYTVWRYGNIASVPYTPSPYVRVGDELDRKPTPTLACMPYEGEGFAYETGHIPNSAVKILLNCPTWLGSHFTHLRVFKGDTEITGSPFTVVQNQTQQDITEISAGSYSAYLTYIENGADKYVSGRCHWSVKEGSS